MDKVNSTSDRDHFQNLNKMRSLNFFSHSCYNLSKWISNHKTYTCFIIFIEIVPSKFVLNSPDFGGTQVYFRAFFNPCGIARLAVKSKRNFFSFFLVAALILLLSKVCSFSLVLFLWVQMNQAMVAKISSTLVFCRIRPTRSEKGPCKASKSLTQLNSVHHVGASTHNGIWVSQICGKYTLV